MNKNAKRGARDPLPGSRAAKDDKEPAIQIHTKTK